MSILASRFKHVGLSGIVLLACQAFWVTAASGVQDPLADPSDRQAQVASLIDQFTVVSHYELNYSSYFTSSIDPSREYSIAVHGNRPWRVEPGDCNELIQELVNLGAAAVPMLVDHLDDDRETKIRLQKPGFGSIELVRWYDHNRNGSFKPDLDPAAGNYERLPDGHQLKVGDLCFDALGKIVNRGFHAASIPPGPGLEVTSPILSPSILKAAREEWGGLTIEDHKASLSFDALPVSRRWRSDGAMRRLIRYYPDVAETVALDALARPMYDSFVARNFAWNSLAKTDDPDELRLLANVFFDRYGQQYQQALYRRLQDDEDPEWTRTKCADGRYVVHPFIIRDRLFPKGRPPTDAVQQSDQERFLLSIFDLDSNAVDNRVLELLRALRLDDPPGILTDSFGIACIYKLRGRGHDEELREFCRQRIPRSSVGYSSQLRFLLNGLEAADPELPPGDPGD